MPLDQRARGLRNQAARRARTRLAHIYRVHFMSLLLEECISDPRIKVTCDCGHSAYDHEDKYGKCRDGCECCYLRPDINFRNYQ